MPTKQIFAEISSDDMLLASTAVASNFEVTQTEKSIIPETVIFYPEENKVRLMFSPETASLEEQYVIKSKGLYTIDGDALDINENRYLANFTETPAEEFSVMSLSITDASGKNIGYAEYAGNYTVKLMYTNPGGAITKSVTIKNNDNVLCTFLINAQAGEVRTLTQSVSINAGEVLNPNAVIN